MSLRSLRALPLLLLAGLGVLCAEESPGPGAVPVPGSVPGSVPVVGSVPRRRYSEAALASDYSRTVEHVLGRNFVEWQGRVAPGFPWNSLPGGAAFPK